MSESSNFKISVVEDDPEMARIFDRLLSKHEIKADFFITGREFLSSSAFLESDIVILDERLPDTTGTTLFKQLSKQKSVPLTIMMTGYPDVKSALELTRYGLFHYIKKPFDISEIREVLNSAFQILTSKDKSYHLDEFVGNSEEIHQTKKKLINILRHTTAPCLILGETGTGKELLANIIHNLTYEKHEHLPPMMVVDCTTLSKELIEAELFGAERGAYTGAHTKRIGLIEQARNGTVFLDEVGELNLELQAKFLRFLESGTYRRLAGNETLYFKGRIIAATNRDLKKDVIKGLFREDLYYRLCYNVIKLPPLRQRVSDIGMIATKLLQELSQKYNRKSLKIRKKDIILLENYHWPGNVRQLKMFWKTASFIRQKIRSFWNSILAFTSTRMTRLIQNYQSHLLKAVRSHLYPTNPLER